jgi:transcriptional regulator with XRE-family HTH domain
MPDIDISELDNFGERLKDLRTERKMSQTELADLVGLRYAHVSRYENGGSRPSADMLMKLSKALNVSTDYLLFGKIEDAAKADFKDKDFLNMFKQAENLPPEDKELVKKFLGSFLKNKKFEELANAS